MTARMPMPLSPQLINIGDPEFAQVCGWRFPENDSYVTRVLKTDIPIRAKFGNCRIRVYRDPSNVIVGFGKLDPCYDYEDFTDGKLHPYLPLLAVNPQIQSLGYGTSIVRHLIDEAALLVRSGCHDVLFLDVYENNPKAIKLYEKMHFGEISLAPIPDPNEDRRTYIIMAKKLPSQ